ncbi:MAG: hypothetical protein ABSB24_14905 [Gaiellaceae bacterium]|jgi:hypothetical protein
MMRKWNMRSGSCWAIAALATSAVALGLTAGQASAIAQKRTPTGRVSLAEWTQWNSEATKLNASFNATLVVESGFVYQCDAIAKSGAASEEAIFKHLTNGTAIQPKSDQDASVKLALWGKGLARRASTYRTASGLIYAGALDMGSALVLSQVVLHSLGVLNCNQATNEAKAQNYWFIGYKGHVIPGLAALRKVIH